jgi:hypothetical protein
MRLSVLRAGRSPFTPREIPGTHFCYRLSRPQGHSSAGRIRPIRKSNDLIGNRTRYLPACSIVPQQSMLSSAPGCHINLHFYICSFERPSAAVIFQRCWVCILAGKPCILTEVYHGFPQSVLPWCYLNYVTTASLRSLCHSSVPQFDAVECRHRRRRNPPPHFLTKCWASSVASVGLRS